METFKQGNIEKLLRCWGKTDPNSEDGAIFHPALYHMIDVGFVAKHLLDDGSSPRWRRILGKVFAYPENELNNWLPFFIAIHDLGKISASFQRMNDPQYERLKAEGFSFGSSRDVPHPLISRQFIWKEWPEKSLLTDQFREVIREAAAGHHGQFPSPGGIKNISVALHNEEPAFWKDLRAQAYFTLLHVFPVAKDIERLVPPNLSSAVMELTGFLVLCDWIGSDQRFFTPKCDVPFEDYLHISDDKAKQAVKEDGFNTFWLGEVGGDFGSVFTSIDMPRPLQLAIDAIPTNSLSDPSLIVIEAPTGEGKTEAALALAHKIGRIIGSDEFYYALPTMATSNQMFLRVQKYLHENLKLRSSAKLVHGQAYLLQDAIDQKPLSNGGNVDDDWISLDWFNSKKRALLAPFGVGTIDQIELGALNTRHVSLRLAGLAGKVIILDEVHAYDTYMTTIVHRLLEWLKELGAYVILLSATLPAQKKNDLMKVYGGNEFEPSKDNGDYPLLQVINPSISFILSPAAYQPTHEVNLKWLNFSEGQYQQKAAWLKEQVRDGGCIVWMTNTVERAQRIYASLRECGPSDVEIFLSHARFPLIWREEIEKTLVEKFGPDKSNRPKKAIVIGTQVLEQSLDLDFDQMVSDLAPIDFLLQRAGRLHRHRASIRPEIMKDPYFFINLPRKEDSDLSIYIDGLIYDEFILRRTFQVLEQKSVISHPGDFRSFVEAVYNNDIFPASETLQNAYAKLKVNEKKACDEAHWRLILSPNPEDIFTGPMSNLTFTESESYTSWMVAKTRLGEPSITVIPLEDDGEVCHLPGSTLLLQKCLPPDRNIQFELMRHQVSISHAEVVEWLLKNSEPLPALFSQSSLLRNVYPLWLKNGRCNLITDKAITEVNLDKELGLVIHKKGGE